MSAARIIRFVCATRVGRAQFDTETALGRSLSLYRKSVLFELDLYESNSRGLPLAYNQSIEDARARPAALVFVHDDVFLSDFYWHERILRGLEHFRLVGVAGNRRRVPRQQAWAIADARLGWDAEHLSGVVAHGGGFPSENVIYFGAPRQECKLLDGVLLAANSETLHEHGIRFDTRFDFHFYDMDLCRQFEAKGLSMGTWPIGLIHQSVGPTDSPEWRKALGVYRAKYPD
jgi:GT2 family glycosyltransferase